MVEKRLLWGTYVVKRLLIFVNTLMRANEFITEAQLLRLSTSRHGGIVKVWVNPTQNDLRQLLKQFDLRGSAWQDKMIVWNANNYIHDDMTDILLDNGIIDYDDIFKSVSFVLSDTGDFSAFDVWDGEPKEDNGIYYLTDYNNPQRMKSFARVFPQ